MPSLLFFPSNWALRAKIETRNHLDGKALLVCDSIPARASRQDEIADQDESSPRCSERSRSASTRRDRRRSGELVRFSFREDRVRWKVARVMTAREQSTPSRRTIAIGRGRSRSFATGLQYSSGDLRTSRTVLRKTVERIARRSRRTMRTHRGPAISAPREDAPFPWRSQLSGLERARTRAPCWNWIERPLRLGTESNEGSG
jgi:hypothetical protein